MRFIIHEMPYEKPLTAGQWKYIQDGQESGAVEQWRLSEAVDGYRFLRIDLDARAARSGRSYLYHLVLDEHGRAVQLKFRLWAAGPEISGTVLLEDDAVIMSREARGNRQENVVAVHSSYAFWFPATAGLSLLSGLAVGRQIAAITLDTAAADPAILMGPQSTELEISEEATQAVEVMGKVENLRIRTVRWENQERRLWLDESGWPMMMKRGDGLTAVLAQSITYQHISKPGVDPAQHGPAG